MPVRPIIVVGLLIGLLVVPLVWTAGVVYASQFRHWSEARWASAGLAPDPATTPEAVVQVYAARTWGWKGVFAVHSWLVMKRAGADAYERYEVVGWGVRHGRPALRRDMREVDGYWAGNRPPILVDHRGAEAEALIGQIEVAIAAYPYPTSTAPGRGRTRIRSSRTSGAACRNSAWSCPRPRSARITSPTAICSARTPSGTGYQMSLLGLLGLSVSRDEGLELNLLGLSWASTRWMSRSSCRGSASSACSSARPFGATVPTRSQAPRATGRSVVDTYGLMT